MKRIRFKFLLTLSFIFVLQFMFFSIKTLAATDNNILPPGNLTYQFTTPKDVTLSWSSVYGATGYNIYGITEGQLLLLKTITSTTHTFNNLAEGSYAYVVSTLSAVGESGPGAPIYVNVVYPDMLAPTSLTHTIQNGNDIVLSWAASLNAQSYNLYEISEDGQQSLLTSLTGRTYTISNAAQRSYTFAVSAANTTYGVSPVSTPLQVNVTYPVMAAPTSLTSKLQNGNDVVLTWGSASYGSSYKVYELIDGQEVLKTTVSTLTTTLTNVSAGNHTYVVRSVSTRFGESAEGKQVTLNVADIIMQAPANANYTMTNGNNITLTWGSVTYATAYKVYQVVDGQDILKSTVTSTNVSYANLPVGDYIYKIHSYSDRFGESPVGSQISVAIGSVVMTPPNNFSYKINNGNDIVLTWDSVANATNYRIYQINNGVKTLKSTVTGNTVSYTNQPESSYSYQIHAYSTTYGESTEGSSITFTLDFPEMQPPSNLIQTLNNASSFTIKWDAATYATSYKIYQIVNDQKVLKNTVTTTSITYSNMAPGDYRYEVYSISTKFGESSTGSSLLVTLNEQVMQAPTNFTYTAANVNDITLKWNAAEFATSYKVYQVMNGQNVLMKTVTGTSTTFNFLPGGDYRYLVTSVSTLYGESPIGAELEFTLVLPIMTAPDNLTYKIQNVNSVLLTWNTVPYANSYKVYEMINGQKVLKTTVTTLTATIANLSAGDHTYVVNSVSTRFGESLEGSQVSLSLAYQMLPPTNPTSSITNGNDINLTWSAATYANSYKIYQLLNGQKVLKSTITTTSVAFPNLPAGNYEYLVTSVSNVFGESSDSTAISISLVHPSMSAPDNLTYKIQNGNSIVLTWNAVSYATNYRVYELINGQEILKATVTTLTATLTNQSVGEHTYIVHSYSTRFGESLVGGQASLTIAQQMLPPTNLTYTLVNGNDIKLTWTAATFANSYQIYQMVDGQKTLVRTVTTTSTTFTNMPAGDYEYIVSTVSTIFGESIDGATITFPLIHPVMAAPANPIYSIANGNDITLRWSAVTYATSYNIYQVSNGQKTLVKNLTGTTISFTYMPAGEYDYIITSVSTRFGESADAAIEFNLVHPIMASPANFLQSITNGNDITLKWNSVTYATSYNVYQVFNEQKTFVKTLTGTTVSFTNMPAGEYVYIITSVSTRFGESADSAIEFNLVHPIMASPSNFLQSITNGNDITLKWNAVTYATSYNVYQVINGQKTLVKTLTGTTVSFTNMPEGIYSYEVDSYSTRFGESPIGSTANFTLTWPVVQAPILTDTVFNINNVTLSWQTVSWANEYRVYEIKDNTRQLLYKGTQLSYKLYNLTEDTHSYEVTAYNTRFGESTPSNRITKVIIYPIMVSPTANLRLIDSKTALIYWNFITYANGYNVYELVDGEPVLLIENLNNLSYQLNDLTYKDHVYYVTSYSNSFGESDPSNTVLAKLIIDTEAPITTFDAPINWVNQIPVTVTLSATDNETGVAKTFYSLNDGVFTEGTAIVIEKEGIHKITFYSTDKVGNKEDANTVYIKIDKTAPVTTSNVPTIWSREDVLVTLTASDSESGVASTYYSIDGSEYAKGTSFAVTGEGIHIINYYSVDAAGNKEETKTEAVRIDRSVPMITMNLSKEIKLGTTLQLTYFAQDELSGIASESMVVYAPNDTTGKVLDNNAKLLIDKPGVYNITVTVVDAAGNRSKITRQIVIYIEATIDVNPTVIKGNNGIFTVRVGLPSQFNTKDLDLNTATLNGVSALSSNNGYYNQVKLGQFKFERSDFTWDQPYVTVEFRCYINGYLVIGQTTVKVQK